MQSIQFLSGAVFVSLGGLALAQSTTRLSVSVSGGQANGYSGSPAISADGRFVAFTSLASNLVSGDTNAAADVFVRDVRLGVTERVSLTSSATQANGVSDLASISADGRYVSFRSRATNMPSGTPSFANVYVRDRVLGTTELVSVSSSGVPGNQESTRTHISADGRYIAFISQASNLVPSDTNLHLADAFVRDRLAGTTTLASVGNSGVQPDFGGVRDMGMSADGHVVAFVTEASNLDPADTNSQRDVFVRDLLHGTTELVSVSATGVPESANCWTPELSADGRFVSFPSDLSNLVAVDTNSSRDIFVHDRQLHTTEIVSVNSSGVQANFGGSVSYPSTSANGRYVEFTLVANNLVPGDTNVAVDVFVHDRLLGTTERASVSSSGAEGFGGGSFDASISADGRYVAFESAALNLVPGDVIDTYDVFLRDRAAPGVASCFGDGTGTPCPCGPSPAPTGCLNSLGLGGALVANGMAMLSDDSLRLDATNVPNSAVLFFQSQVSGGASVVFGDGLLCGSGPHARLGLKTASAGSAHYPGSGDPSISAIGLVLTPGTRAYQTWYRDSAAFCTTARFNLTNGWRTSWLQ